MSYDWYHLSILLEEAGQQDEALDAARKAVVLAPHSAHMLVNLGNRLLSQGKPHEAIPCLEKATRAAPSFAQPLGELGIAHYRAHHFAAAAEYLDSALRKDPEHPDAWAYLGVSLDEIGRFEGAVCALETAVFAKPDSGWTWARLGKALRALGRHTEAIAAYEKAIRHDFAPTVVWWDMGLSAAEIPNLACLEEACRGLRKLDASLSAKLRRRLRTLKTRQPAAAPPAEGSGASAISDVEERSHGTV
jgi:tetratricopeptide (TPR) repeat protein